MLWQLCRSFLVQNGNKNATHLKPRIAQQTLQANKESVSRLIERESQYPIQHTKVYDQYTFLINKQVSSTLRVLVLIRDVDFFSTHLPLSDANIAALILRTFCCVFVLFRPNKKWSSF